MAIVKKSDLKLQVKLSSDIELPRDRYTLRCKSEDFGLSKGKQQPMVTRVWELIEPSVITVGDKSITIAGTEFTQYLSLGSDDPKNVDFMQAKFLEENGKIGLPSEEVDTEHPIPTPKEINDDPSKKELSAVGKVVDAMCGSEEYSPRKSPTPAQKAAKKQGDPILVNGKPIVRFKPVLFEIYGLSSGAPTSSGGPAGVM